MKIIKSIMLATILLTSVYVMQAATAAVGGRLNINSKFNRRTKANPGLQLTDPFKGDGFIGTYDSSAKTVTVKDSSGTVMYSFKNVVDANAFGQKTDGLTYIGSIDHNSVCSAGGACSMVYRLPSKLYGKLLANNN